MEEAENENVGILVLEPKSLRPFKTKDEYLYAMKEDLAEWFNCLYEGMWISADNFFEYLETGVLLCQHANRVRRFADEQKCNRDFAVKSNFVRDIQIPQYDVQFKVDIKRGTFLARDNISNFITWTAKMGIPEVLRFETDDLVLRKNERSVILCLLEVARVGAKFGMLAPTIVQMEEEIDNEIETGEPPLQIKTCDMKSLDEMVRELVGRCTCPVQFPVIKVGDGKYKIGDNQTLVFVRILRSHVMIRVGGGWDTLEHYLDRHDPCRCGFQGSRHGAKATSRRASQPAVSKSLPCTPKCPRKLSMATPLNTTHSGSTTRSVGLGMRSMSPGPNSRKLSLTGKSSCQLGSNVLSPVISNKQLNLTTGLNTSENIKSSCTSDKQQIISDTELSLPAKQNISKSGIGNSGCTAKQSQASLTRQVSLNATGSQKTPTSSTAESCSRSNRRSQSPVSRKSAFPEPHVNDRLTSPSPAPSNHTSDHSNSTQSAPATNRCSSPMKQITLSELRSSREGKVAQSKHVQRFPADSMKSELTYESNDSNFPLDKVNTMSLVEFRSLLNNALSIPNGNSDPYCKSFESTGSQSSAANGRCKDQSSKNTSSFAKRASSNRVVCGTKSASSIRLVPETKCAIGKYAQNSRTNSKSYLNTSSTEYSSVNSSSDKINRPSTLCRTNLSIPENGFKSKARAQSASTASRTVAPNSNAIYKPKTPSSISRTKTKASSISENSKSSENSRSTSHSSLQSYESIDDSQNSLGITTSDHSIHMLTPSSSESDFSFRNNFQTNLDVPVIGYSRSNSYSAFSAGNCCHGDNSSNSARASSEPKEIVLIDTQIYGIRGGKALNVGYATFSRGESIDIRDCHQHHDVENAMEISCKQVDEMVKFATAPNDQSQSKIRGITCPLKPSGRQTPSHIPRPITPTMSRKMSLPEPSCSSNISIDNDHICDRTPSPRKSIVIAQAAHNTDTDKQGSVHALRNRSTTPGLESDLSPTTMSPKCVRKSMTPGLYLQKTSTLRSNSAKTSRDSLIEAFEQIGDNKLSVNNGENGRSNTSGQPKKNQCLEHNHLSRRPSKDQSETVITVNVDRSKNQHVIAIKDETDVKNAAKRPKILAIVQAENNNAKPQNKNIHNVSKTRSHSVEFQRFVPRLNLKGDNEYTLAIKSCEGVDHSVYDRTQEWVQTAAEQNQVQKKIVLKGNNTRSRRAMTPNSFDMRRDKVDDEPRTLEEIKAALQLPIHVINEINLDQLEAPPEDPAMYATMEKLFIELKMQELKNSTNESVNKNDVSKSSRSNRRNNDLFSADCKKNEKGKSCLTSAKAVPAFGQQSALIPNKTDDTTNSNLTEQTLPIKSSISNNSESNIVVHQTNSPLQQQVGNSPKADVLIVTPPSPKTLSHPFRSASPRTTSQPARPSSPRSISQRQILTSPMMADTSSPSTISNSMRAKIRTQPQRPASTPPRFTTQRQRSKSSDDIENEIAIKRKETSSILNKIKEILKVKPRKDKTEGVKNKTKIPAPKSLASMEKTCSFSAVLRSMSVPNEDISESSYVFNDSERNGYPEFANGALNETLSGRSETSGNSSKWNTPLTTGRSSIITESIEKNKTTSGNRLTRAVSVEKNTYFD